MYTDIVIIAMLLISVVLYIFTVGYTAYNTIKRKYQIKYHLTKRKYKRDMRKLNEILDRYYNW